MYVLCKSSSSYYWAWLRPKPWVFKHFSLVCFIMAEICLIYGRNLTVAEICLIHGRTLPNSWQKSHSGRNLPNTWQKSACCTLCNVHALIIWWFISFFLFYNIAKVFLGFQKFVNQLSLLFSQHHLPNIWLILSQCNLWRFPWFLTGRCFFLLYVSFIILDYVLFMQQGFTQWLASLLILLVAIFLGIPFLLLLAYFVLLRLVHCFGLRFNCFLLLPVVWVLTSLARDTFWVRFNLLPLSCHYDCFILDTIFVKQYCPRSSFHNFFRSVSCTQYLSWDRADNVLRVNLTLTLEML